MNLYGTQGNPPEKAQLSVVIPAWSGTDALAEMALGLAKQVRPMCDELIITEDSGNYYKELQEISDLYLMHENLGDVVNSILGMRIALGEYIAVINTDVDIAHGNLRDLCIPGRTVSPLELNGIHQEFHGSFFVVPRTVIDQYGTLLIERQGKGADFEYMYRIQRTYQFSDKLAFKHAGNLSHIEWRDQHGIPQPRNGKISPHQ